MTSKVGASFTIKQNSMDVRKQRPIEKIRAKLIELDLNFTVSLDSNNYATYIVKDERFYPLFTGRFDTVMIWLRDNGAGLKAKPEPSELEQLNERVKELGLPFQVRQHYYNALVYSVYNKLDHVFCDNFTNTMAWINQQPKPAEPAFVQTELEAVPLMYDVEVVSRFNLHEPTVVKMTSIPRKDDVLSFYAKVEGGEKVRHWLTVIINTTYLFDENNNLIGILAYG